MKISRGGAGGGSLSQPWFMLTPVIHSGFFPFMYFVVQHKQPEETHGVSEFISRAWTTHKTPADNTLATDVYLWPLSHMETVWESREAMLRCLRPRRHRGAFDAIICLPSLVLLTVTKGIGSSELSACSCSNRII